MILIENVQNSDDVQPVKLNVIRMLVWNNGKFLLQKIIWYSGWPESSQHLASDGQPGPILDIGDENTEPFMGGQFIV